jgi:hypothetical protein
MEQKLYEMKKPSSNDPFALITAIIDDDSDLASRVDDILEAKRK